MDGTAQKLEFTDIVLAVLYSVVILTGVVGNSLVIAVVWKTKSMHTATNFLLVNLAVSDILVLIWCPKTYDFAVTGSLPGGRTGDYLCRFFVGDAVDTLGLGVTLLTLTVLAIERYQALVTPMNTRYVLTKQSVMYAIAGTWIVSLAIDIPDFVFTQFEQQTGACISPWSLKMAHSKATYVFIAIVLYIFFPFFVMTFCYFQILRGMFITHTICAGPAIGNSEKKKLAVLIIAVTAVFYISFLPYSVFILHIAFAQHFEIDHHENEVESIVLKVLQFLTVASCASNPVLYAWQSGHYRQGFKRLFCRNNSVMDCRISKVVELQVHPTIEP